MGLEKQNVMIYLVSEELQQLCTKARFAKLFDFAVVGFYHSQDVKGPFPALLRDKAQVYIELPKYIMCRHQS